MRLAHSTWPEIEAYLEHSRGVIVPLGSMEQHGPNGLFATDAICAEEIAWAVGEAHGVLVGPTLELGVAQFNLGFPGTVTLRAETLMAVIRDYVRSLARHGVERIYFLNGHGGNIAPANAAFQDLYAEASFQADAGNRASLRCRLRSWWEYPATNALRHELYGADEGLHATPSEVAITQAARPETIHRAEMAKPERLPEGFYRDYGGDKHFDAAHHRRRFPDGRIGSDPSLATPEAGVRLIEAAVPEAFADYGAFLAEE